MANRSPSSSSDDDYSDSGGGTTPDSLSPRSEDLTPSQKSRKASRKTSSISEDAKHSSRLVASGSSSSVDSRFHLSTSSLPTVEEGEIIEASRRRKGSENGSGEARAKVHRSRTQPASDKLKSSSKRSKLSKEEKSPGTPSNSKKTRVEGVVVQEVGEVITYRSSKRHGARSPPDDDASSPTSSHSNLVRPASTSDVSAPNTQSYTTLVPSPSAMPLHASTSNVNKRKSQRRKLPKQQGSSESTTGSDKSDKSGSTHSKRSKRSKGSKGSMESEDSSESLSSNSSIPSLPVSGRGAGTVASDSSSCSLQSLSGPSSSSPPLPTGMAHSHSQTIHGHTNSIPNGHALLSASAPGVSAPLEHAQPHHHQHHKQHMAALLIDVLRSPDHVALLHKHMRRELCDENLDFWLAVQRFIYSLHYEALRSGKSPDAQDILNQGQSVYRTFIAPSAPRPMNLPAKVAARIRHQFTVVQPTIPVTTAIFSEAQATTFKVIECDPFPRFVNSAGEDQVTSNLVQLGVSLPSSDFEYFLSVIDENKSKWSKMASESGIKAHKMESHGVYNMRCSIEVPASVASTSLFISQPAYWSQWFWPGATCLELEHLSTSLQVIFSVWPSSNASNRLRDTVVAVGSRHEPSRSIILFKSIPHATAPHLESSTNTDLFLSGWRVAPGTSPDTSFVTFCIRADKSDVKKWDRDVSMYIESLSNLKNIMAKRSRETI